MPRGNAIVSWAVTAALLLGGPLAPQDAAAAPPGDAVAEAQTLFQDGQAKYETLDYEGAIDAWMKAYVKFPETEDYVAIKGTVLYAIAQARLDLFDAEKDVQHLKHAQRILKAYLAKLEEQSDAYHSGKEWLDKVEAKLAEAEGTSEPTPTPAEPTPTPTEEPAPTTDPVEPVPPTDDPPSANRGKALVITGAVLTGVGAAIGVGGGLAFGLRAQSRSDAVSDVFEEGNPDGLTVAEARDLESEGEKAELLQLVSIGVGGAVGIVGVALLAVGLKEKKRASDAPSVSATPTFRRGMAGLSVGGRF